MNNKLKNCKKNRFEYYIVHRKKIIKNLGMDSTSPGSGSTALREGVKTDMSATFTPPLPLFAVLDNLNDLIQNKARVSK